MISILFTLLFAVAGSNANTEVPDLKSQLTASIDSLLTIEFMDNGFSGSIVIGNKEQVIYQKHLGFADRTWEIMNDSATLFDIASLNKSFIGTLIMIAVEENKLQLNSTLTDLLHDHTYEGYFDSNITIHHLLSHTAGLADYGDVADALSMNDFNHFKRLHFTNKEYVNFISELAPISEPGQRFYYSNFGYHLLCIILEKIYQVPFGQILENKICTPIGLQHTLSTTENEAIISKLAEGYNFDDTSQKWFRNKFIDRTLGRRIFASALDLFRWGQAIANQALLSEESIKKITTNHLVEISNEVSYGYGWVISQPGDILQIGNLNIDLPYIIHGGSTEGYKSMLAIINDGEYIIAVTANSGDKTHEMQLTQKIVNLLPFE